RDLVAGERLAGRRVHQLRVERREVAVAHRLGRHRRVLIEDLITARAVVVDGEEAPARAVVDAGDLHRPAERAAEALPRIGRDVRRIALAQLERRRVQHRSAEAVGAAAAVGVLAAAAAAYHEAAEPGTAEAAAGAAEAARSHAA